MGYQIIQPPLLFVHAVVTPGVSTSDRCHQMDIGFSTDNISHRYRTLLVGILHTTGAFGTSSEFLGVVWREKGRDEIRLAVPSDKG